MNASWNIQNSVWKLLSLTSSVKGPMRYHLVSRQMVDRLFHMNQAIGPEGLAQMRVRWLVLRRIISSPLVI